MVSLTDCGGITMRMVLCGAKVDLDMEKETAIHWSIMKMGRREFKDNSKKVKEKAGGWFGMSKVIF